jgi:thioredoxin reductase (NADPH)
MTEDEDQRVAYPRLDEAQIAALEQVGSRRSVADGQPLFRAGDRGGGFFVVLSGEVEIVDHSGETPRIVTVHQAGEFTGDIDILSRRRPVVSAVARGDTEVLHVPSARLRRLLGERPALGEVILQAFIARREMLVESGYQGLRLIGSAASRDTFRIRDFLSRNQIPFTWIDLDTDPGVAELLEQFGIREEDTPVVAFGGQPLLRNPDIRALAEIVGLKPPLGEAVYDLAIVGAGPAGLGAAVYASSEGLSTVVLDTAGPGGQAIASSKIENYLGFPTGISGADLTARATLQAQKFGARFSVPSRAVGIECDGPHPVVVLDEGERVAARCVLIATGADYRRLGVPERERYEGLGVYYSATQTEIVSCRGSEVVVVGGGNSAGQAVMFLSEHTHRVHLLLRGGDLRRSMSSYLADRIEATPNIEVHRQTEIRHMMGGERLEAVEVQRTETGDSWRIETPAVFTFIGAIPRTEWLPREIETNDKGFVRTGSRAARSPHWTEDREPFGLETSLPGVFAAGDVRLGSTKRVASAVGEGGAVMQSIHEFLAQPWIR